MLLKVLTDHLSLLWPKFPFFVDKLLLLKALSDGLVYNVASENLFDRCLF